MSLRDIAIKLILSGVALVLVSLLCMVLSEARAQTFTESMTQAGAAVEARIQQSEKAAAAATARADEVIAALQVETADIAAINVAAQRLADEMALLRKEYAAALARLDAIEAAQKAQPPIQLREITVAVPAGAAVP
jgi:uncharacterized membrane protein YeiB